MGQANSLNNEINKDPNKTYQMQQRRKRGGKTNKQQYNVMMIESC